MNFESRREPFELLIPLTSDLFAATEIGSNKFVLQDETIVEDYEIIYEIIQGSDYGEVVMADNSMYGITSFTKEDIKLNKIAFKQQQLVSRVTIFNIKLKVFNSVTMEEEVVEVRFTASPENLFAPQVEMEEPVLLLENSEITLSTSHLSVRHLKKASNRIDCLIQSNIVHSKGYFTINGLRRTQFTYSELASGKVSYSHNGDESYTDNVVFVIRAGENETRVLLQILVNPLDDTKPIPAKTFQQNEFLILTGHNWKTVTAYDVFYTDSDSSTLAISFSLRKENEGNILFRKWNAKLGKFEENARNWTQHDMIFGKVQCRNDMTAFNTSVLQQVKLDVCDNAIFPNRDKHILDVKFVHLDEKPPVVSQWAALYVEIKEYKITIINRKMLLYNDEGSFDPVDILYKITTKPYDKNPDNPLKVGQLCLTANNQLSLSSMNCNIQQFTQKEINGNELVYKPPITERGVITRYIEFIFTVSDSAGNSLPNQYFSIDLKPIPNSPPRVYIKYLRVQANSTTSIDKDLFEVIDPEGVSPLELRFSLRETPKYGKLLRDGAKLSLDGVKTFSVGDINSGRISLRTGSSANLQDQFVVVLSDGVNLMSIKVFISIDPFNEYSVQSEVDKKQVHVNIYVRQSSAVSLAFVSTFPISQRHKLHAF